MAGRAPAGAPAGHAVQLHHAVRPHRDGRGSRRSPAAPARAAGRDGRLPDVPPAGLPPRQQRADEAARADGRRGPAPLRGVAPAAAQHPAHQGLLDHAGREDGPDGAVVRRGRPGRHRAGGEDLSHGRGRDAADHDATRDRAPGPQRRPHPGRTRHAVQRGRRGRGAGRHEALPPRRAQEPGCGVMNAGRRVRGSAVSVLNARPITWGLERGLGEDTFQLEFDLPSRCAARLAAGDVDLALIPTAAYREIEAETSLRAVPGIGITSFGNVRTVLLVGDVPWEQMTAISLDGASRSSAALVRHMTRHRGLPPQFAEEVHGAIEGAAQGTTGALVIGDAGFAVAGRYPHVYDLGAEWKRMTGLPFVFALWAGRPAAVDDAGIALLRESLDMGLAARAALARAWAAAHGGPPALYEHYLTENIHYRLGSEALSGAGAFLA